MTGKVGMMAECLEEPSRASRGNSAKRGALGYRAVMLLLASTLGLATACASTDSGDAGSAASFTGPDAVEQVDVFIAEHPVDKGDPDWRLRVKRPPAIQFRPGRTYYWILHTSEGIIKIKLLPQYAPLHVASTIYLTRIGFYDSLGFHRIIPQFMVQGGDPTGTGAGGPAYRYGGEIHKNAKHKKRGVVSAANTGRPRSDGSQFFILFKEQEGLDGKHTVFGQVTEGKGTLSTLESLGTKSGKPNRIAQITRAEILSE